MRATDTVHRVVSRGRLVHASRDLREILHFAERDSAAESATCSSSNDDDSAFDKKVEEDGENGAPAEEHEASALLAHGGILHAGAGRLAKVDAVAEVARIRAPAACRDDNLLSVQERGQGTGEEEEHLRHENTTRQQTHPVADAGTVEKELLVAELRSE